MTYDVIIDGKKYRVELAREDGKWKCVLDGREVPLDATLTEKDVLSLLIGGTAYEVMRERTPTDLHYWVGTARYAAEVQDPRSLRSRKAAGLSTEGAKKLVAPMPGKIVRVIAPEKSEVEAGQGVIVVEAMKMQNELKSPKKGVVQKMLVVEGAAVNAGEVLAIID
ncbi:MAG TPA: biotin/lipoyl-containing protein [Terriglobales bacterium]|nr:biotin/lipoyl-containing protein [Terriglobales bacterium]